MAQVLIYSTTVCPYCVRAKALLKKKGVQYDEINLTEQPELREEMIQKAGGRRTVPQIFIDGNHVGGCDDIHALDAEGKLDPMLGLN
ncbi:MAG: glutaredoxin 3 [Magnetococcales bacterium]|nr:glutaredoxin 3 [Magnetococcales bacterium]NGZ28142.1 glutaredoxin 3 [Magnetococcales bacterium]